MRGVEEAKEKSRYFKVAREADEKEATEEKAAKDA